MNYSKLWMNFGPERTEQVLFSALLDKTQVQSLQKQLEGLKIYTEIGPEDKLNVKFDFLIEYRGIVDKLRAVIDIINTPNVIVSADFSVLNQTECVAREFFRALEELAEKARLYYVNSKRDDIQYFDIKEVFLDE